MSHLSTPEQPGQPDIDQTEAYVSRSEFYRYVLNGQSLTVPGRRAWRVLARGKTLAAYSSLYPRAAAATSYDFARLSYLSPDVVALASLEQDNKYAESLAYEAALDKITVASLEDVTKYARKTAPQLGAVPLTKALGNHMCRSVVEFLESMIEQKR